MAWLSLGTASSIPTTLTETHTDSTPATKTRAQDQYDAQTKGYCDNPSPGAGFTTVDWWEGDGGNISVSSSTAGYKLTGWYTLPADVQRESGGAFGLDVATTRISTSATITYSTIASNAKRYIVDDSWFYYIAYAKYTSYYIVKYNGNGATSGSMSDDEYLHGTAYNLTPNEYSKSATITYNGNGGTAGRTSDTRTASFLGWATSASGAVAYSDGQSVTDLTQTAGGTVNLYAKWGAFSSVTLPNATKPGAAFAGWYTAASGGTRVGGSGDIYTPTADVTLYAQWTPYITIVFSPNGGYISDGTYFKNILEGGTYGTLPTASRPGYTFLGWFTDPTSGTQVTSESVILPYDHTIYAHWQGATVTHTLYFDPAGGTCSTASKTITPGVAYGTLPTATRSGYSFLGWFLSTIGTDQVTAATIAGDDDLTVYAHWQGDSLTITFNANGGSVSETTRTVIYGNQYSTLPIPTYSGKNFVGWFTAATGGVQVTASDVPTANTTLYAHWEEGIFWWQI